jgi:TIR domain
VSQTPAKSPVVFLCHASDDDELARQIATDLVAAGIRTFYSEWSIRSGQSLRQRIDEGLGDCTHFVVLLTPISIDRPWVKAEIDAAFVLKVQGQAAFIPLRHRLPMDRIPPLLAALHCPELKDYPQDIRLLISDIYEVPREPPLGERPTYTISPLAAQAGLSVAAMSIAEQLLQRSARGRHNDPKLEVADLLSATGLANNDFAAAVDELLDHGLVDVKRAIGSPPFGYFRVAATEALFITLDHLLMGWSPAQDALRLATDLLNSEHQWLSTYDAAERLQWPPRRMNPALAFLIGHDLVTRSNSIDATFVTTQIGKNAKTIRFVRQQS